MPRFFVDQQPQDGVLTLTGENAHHAGRVLRLRVGEGVTLCDGAGMDFDCTVEAVEKEAVTCRAVSRHAADTEPKQSITLFMALPKGDKSKYVLQTLEYIAAHYADADINITTIARSIGISEGHLSHVFKKETSYTALGYLTLYRIHMARRLLADCRYKVYEVAGMVGYRDVAYFGSTFKKLTGLSPSEYQDRCR